MTVAETLALIATLRALLTEVRASGITVRYAAAGRVAVTEAGRTDVLPADEAADWILDLAVLGEMVQADPEPFHPDTRAAYGIVYYERIILGSPIEVVEITA